MKKIAYALIVIGLILIINSLVHSIVDLWSKQDLVKQAQIKLDHEKKENLQLKKQLITVGSKAFVEQEARDKLFMVKPGESDVIIPDNLLPNKNEAKSESQKPNWQMWMDLFFPNK